MADQLADIADQLLQGIGLRAAQLEALAEGLGILQCVDEMLGDIAHVDGRELRIRARQRHDRRDLQQGGEAVQEGVIAPEDHRWAKNRDREGVAGEH